MPKEIVEKIKIEIDKAKSILLHCHPSPDPDSVGSSLAMKLALEQLGKKVTLIQGDSMVPEAFEFPGVNTIVKKNFFEIDLKEFDLFIIQDSGSIDRVSEKGSVVFPDEFMTIVIDHHASNPGYGKINLILPNYPATAQILYDLFGELGVKIDHDIALNLFIGIYTDTGGFKYRESSPETLRIAAELAKIAPDYSKVMYIMENSRRKEGLIFESLALSSLKTYFNDEFAIVSVNYDDLQKNKILDEDIFTGYISSKIKSIKGVDFAGTFVEVQPNMVKISLRSGNPDKFDVSKLAVALGGGGHKSASGIKLKMDIPSAIEKVVNTIKELYNLK